MSMPRRSENKAAERKTPRQREESQRSARCQTETMLTLLPLMFDITRGAAESLFLHVDDQKLLFFLKTTVLL